MQWSLKYRIRGEEYDEDAKMYLVRKYLGVNEEQFEVTVFSLWKKCSQVNQDFFYRVEVIDPETDLLLK